MAHYKRNKRIVARKRAEFIGLLNELRGNLTVRYIDRSNFEPGMCCNGGKYEFITRYSLDENTGEFAIEYFTSAEFSYCEVYGHFQRCLECSQYDDEYGCMAKCERISRGELAHRIMKPCYENCYWKL